MTIGVVNYALERTLSQNRDRIVTLIGQAATSGPQWGRQHLDSHRPFGIEAHSVAADPLFEDFARDDFRFRPGSPALKLGIPQPFDVRRAGVQWGDRRGE